MPFDLYKFFIMIFFSIIGMFLSYMLNNWLYSWKFLKLILNFFWQHKIFKLDNFLFVIINKIKSLFYFFSKIDKQIIKKKSESNILVFWGFLVIVVVVNIYFCSKVGGFPDSFTLPPSPPSIDIPSNVPNAFMEGSVKSEIRIENNQQSVNNAESNKILNQDSSEVAVTLASTSVPAVEVPEVKSQEILPEVICSEQIESKINNIYKQLKIEINNEIQSYVMNNQLASKYVEKLQTNFHNNSNYYLNNYIADVKNRFPNGITFQELYQGVRSYILDKELPKALDKAKQYIIKKK